MDWFDDGPDSGPGDPDAGPAEPSELPAPGRTRVLSAIGREGAAERWYDSEHGPRTRSRTPPPRTASAAASSSR